MSNHYNEAKLEQLIEMFRRWGFSWEDAEHYAVEQFKLDEENTDANPDR